MSRTIEVTLFNEDGDEYVAALPAIKIVCGRCDGTGKHVNPAVDGHGLSREDFDEDPDFAEDYFSGVFDVTCHECHGERVLLVVDHEQAAIECPDDYQRWCDHERELANMRAEMAAERRMGA